MGGGLRGSLCDRFSYPLGIWHTSFLYQNLDLAYGATVCSSGQTLRFVWCYGTLQWSNTRIRMVLRYAPVVKHSDSYGAT
eukprot:3864787-Rhodomonas_salina.1